MENNAISEQPSEQIQPIQPVRRGRRLIYDTEEKKEARGQEKLIYYKEYYKNKKEKIDRMNTENWKAKLKEMKEIVNNKEVIEFYNKIKNPKNSETLS